MKPLKTSNDYILCFSWNTDQIPLCESFLDNKSTNFIGRPRGIFSKNTPCYNPLFFDDIERELLGFAPPIKMVVFFTEGDLESGTWFHSDFLPNKMKDISGRNISGKRRVLQIPYSYKLLTRDKYSGQTLNNVSTVMRMSIYVWDQDNSSKAIELTKGLLFNDNKMDCNINLTSSNYVEQAKILALYTETNMGRIAFIGLQYAENTPSNGRICIKQLEDKFIKNKNIDYVIIMGDFSNDYGKKLTPVIPLAQAKAFSRGQVDIEVPVSTDKDQLLQEYLNEFRKTSLPDEYREEDRDSNIQNNRINKKYVNENYDFSPTYDNGNNIGYHDRILYKSLTEKQIIGDVYKVIRGNPIHKYGDHFGILGVYNLIQ